MFLFVINSFELFCKEVVNGKISITNIFIRCVNFEFCLSINVKSSSAAFRVYSTCTHATEGVQYMHPCYTGCTVHAPMLHRVYSTCNHATDGVLYMHPCYTGCTVHAPMLQRVYSRYTYATQGVQYIHPCHPRCTVHTPMPHRVYSTYTHTRIVSLTEISIFICCDRFPPFLYFNYFLI